MRDKSLIFLSTLSQRPFTISPYQGPTISIVDPRWHSSDISWFYWKSIIGIMERKWKEILCNFQNVFNIYNFYKKIWTTNQRYELIIFFYFFSWIQVVKYSWRNFQILCRIFNKTDMSTLDGLRNSNFTFLWKKNRWYSLWWLKSS